MFKKSLNKNIHKAFSLIEISVSLIVIGLIIAGIIQSSKLISKAALTSARAASTSSPVPNISGLLLWLDTVSESSFLPDQAVDGGVLTKWFDINPTSGASAVEVAGYGSVKYEKKAFNSLPGIRFSGNPGDYFRIPNGIYPAGNSPYTIFFVGRPAASGSYRVLMSNSSFEMWYSENTTLIPGTNPHIALPQTGYIDRIIAFSYDGSYNGGSFVSGKGDKMYINGSDNFLTSGHFPATLNTKAISTAYVNVGCNNGANYCYVGTLGEVIFYNRELTDVERKDVEKYLSQKWKIRLQ